MISFYLQPIFRRSYEVYLPLEELQQLLSAAAGSPVDVQIFLPLRETLREVSHD